MKKYKKWLIAALVLVFLVLAWNVAYRLRKSNDNLPSFSTLMAQDENNANNRLKGYLRHQLITVYGQPNDTIAIGTDVWALDDSAYLEVNYNAAGQVKSVRIVKREQ